MPKLIVYSHTEYLDILKIQTDYIMSQFERKDMVLFINREGWDYNKYNSVITYDDSQPYASRLLECLNQVDDDYILLTHDIDILLKCDNAFLIKCYDFLRDNKFDRVDLKHTFNLNSSLKIEWPEDNLTLVRAEHTNDYIYNVNPSIWRRESLLKMLNAFPDRNYRNIEFDVQHFCKQFNIFKFHTKEHIPCGWFKCIPQYKFLHISHWGKLLPVGGLTPDGQSYYRVRDEYYNILNKYNPKIGKTI
jgi:hypothetical protein